ncbi:hypothetical protein Mal4_35100 [Maioricimonas rarisocia]|uniref:DUF1570 domain-containing protein n=1 Tax=Maioricimonas rarisocia TaxID=2528026 RepID=A0A517Z9L0_9PLAN|nr:hypothetical protein Mal4_35100 [Maioricimonas rarisocia]
MIAACLALVAAGCVTPGRNAFRGLPDRHEFRDEGLTIHSDMKLPSSDPLIADLYRVRDQITEVLDLPNANRSVSVYLFRDQERYATYMQTAHPELPNRRAFFIGSTTELAVYAFQGDRVGEDLRHEYTHGLLHATLRTVPLWLDEGLAEYFEVGGTQPGALNRDHAHRLATALENGWRPDLQRLEQLDDIAQMRRVDYQESWAWVHFLLHEAPGGRALLVDYLKELQTTTVAPSLAERIRREIPSAEMRLMSYIATFATSSVGRSVL